MLFVSVSFLFLVGCDSPLPGGVNNPPVVGQELIYFTRFNGLSAVNKKTSNEVWHFATESYVVGLPHLWQNMIFFGENAQKLHALEQKTGRVLWQFHTEGRVETKPAFAQGSIFVGTSSGILYSLEARTGKERWRFQAGSARFCSEEPAWKCNNGISMNPVITNNLVIIGDVLGNLRALTIDKGKLVWESNLSYLGRQYTFMRRGAPVVHKEIMIIPCAYDQVLAVSTKTGKVLWRFSKQRFISSPYFRAPSIAEEPTPSESSGKDLLTKEQWTVYIGDADGYLYAIDAESGKRRWEKRLMPQEAHTVDFYQTLIWKHLVLCVTQGRNQRILYAVNRKDGTIVWQFESGSVFFFAFLWDDSIVISGFDRFHFLDPQSGKETRVQRITRLSTP